MIKNYLINKNNITFFNICCYLAYLLPIALVTGPFLSDLFLSIIALFFIFISIKKKLWSYYKNKFVYIFFFFYFYILFLDIFFLFLV